jgi:hypothetical protein
MIQKKSLKYGFQNFYTPTTFNEMQQRVLLSKRLCPMCTDIVCVCVCVCVCVYRMISMWCAQLQDAFV